MATRKIKDDIDGQEEFNKELLKTRELLKQIGQSEEDIYKYLLEMQRNHQKENDTLDEYIKFKEEEVKLETEVRDLTYELNKITKENYYIQKITSTLDKDIAFSYQKMVDTNTSFAKAQFGIYQLTGKMTKQLAEGNAERFNSELELLKIQQKFPELTQEELINLDTILQKTQAINNEYYKNKKTIESVNELLEENKKEIELAKNQTIGYAKTLWQILKGHGAQIIFIGTLISKAKELNEVMEESRKDLGLTYTQMLGMTSQAASVGFSPSGILFGVGMKEAMESSRAIVDQTGQLNKATNETVLETGKLMSLYGLSGDEAAKLTQLTDITGQNNIESAKALALANNVPIGKMLKDVAQNTEFFALHSKEGGANIYKASVFAKKLGLDLSKVEQITAKLLDDPTAAMENGMNASVMLGKQIDVMSIQQQLYNDDQEGALKNIMNQIGGIDKFNKMDRYQKIAIADLLGVQVQDVMKMAKAQSDGVKLTEAMDSNMDKMEEHAMGITKFLKEWGVLAVSFVGSLIQMLPALKSMKDMGWIDKIKGIFGKRGSSGIAGNITESVSDAIPGAMGPTSRIPEVARTKNIESSLTSSSESVGKTGMNMKNIVLGAAAIAIMAGALFVFAKAGQELNTVNPTSYLGAAVGLGILVGALAVVGTIMGTGEGALAIIAGAAAMIIMSGALWVFGKAMQELDKVTDFAKISLGLGMLALAFIPFSLAALAMGFASPGLLAASGSLLIFSIALNSLGQIPDMSGMGLGLIELSKGLIALSGASVLLGIATPFLIAASAGILIFGNSITPMATALDKMKNSLPILSNFLGVFNEIKTSITGINTFFDAISDGIDTMVESLKALDPYSNLLGALSNMSGTPTMTSAPAYSTQSNQSRSIGSSASINMTDSNNLLSEISAKLDALIAAVSQGAKIEIDGVKLMRFMAKSNPAAGTNTAYTSGKGNY